jgi:mannose-6-phosphate isomerase class I
MIKEENSKTDPFLAPLRQEMAEYPRGVFERFPAFTPSAGDIYRGYPGLAESIISQIPRGLRVLIIDGYQGVAWQALRAGLEEELDGRVDAVQWMNMEDCYAAPEEIRERIKPFLGGDDPLFGTHYPFGPEVFFEAARFADFRIKAAIARGKKPGELTIFYGCGSGLLELWDQLWYVDIPKDEIQYRSRRKEITNLGEEEIVSFGDFYKRSYFVEWPALNRLKRQLLPELHLVIDLTDSDAPTMIEGDNFRCALHEISESPFRIRPWFFPGPWGGKFMQGHMGLDPEQPNFAWSFEMIVPENGIVLEKNGKRLECSFDFLMFQETRRVMGAEAAEQFKYEWPIRLDYLDTVDGGNLSTQCHPRPDYIRKNFGETFTQDECYYISNARPDARVYLGLTEDCDRDEFRKALTESHQKGIELDIDQYVNSEPAKPHDLFLIPNGTVHCSGRGNLVLEISATPYIFTFKIYDYLRKNLEGKLRPLNIDRAFDNIYFHRRKGWVQQNLLAKPRLLREGDGWREYVLLDKGYSFYNIHRAEFEREFEFATNGKGFAVNLVEGERVDIISRNGYVTELAYLESMLIPAAAENIQLRNKGNRPCKLVMVYVRPGIGSERLLNDPAG